MLGWAENYRAWLHIFSIIYDVSGNSAAAGPMVRWRQGKILTGVDQTIILLSMQVVLSKWSGTIEAVQWWGMFSP